MIDTVEKEKLRRILTIATDTNEEFQIIVARAETKQDVNRLVLAFESMLMDATIPYDRYPEQSMFHIYYNNSQVHFMDQHWSERFGERSPDYLYLF